MRGLFILIFLQSFIPRTYSQVYEQGEAPNILFFIVNDLNDWVGVLKGHPNAKTPNIDRLAKRGVLFTNAQSISPESGASRAAIFSGLTPTTTGIYRGAQKLRKYIGEKQTLPQYFRNNGYKTLRSGRVFSTYDKPDSDSWDFAFPSLDRHNPAVTVPRRLVLTEKQSKYLWTIEKLDLEDERMDDGKVANWAIEQLNQEHDQPFFLTVGFNHPGLPWMVPQKYFDMHPLEEVVLPMVRRTDIEDVPAISKSQRMTHNGKQRHEKFSKDVKVWTRKVQGYLATCSFVDAQIGRVLEALDDSDYGDDTIVVLCSDNGFHLGEKMMWNNFSLWEEATHVPLIISAGKNFKIPKGTEVNTPVSLINLYPTLVNLCELPFNPLLDGDSMDSLIFGEDSGWTKPALSTYYPNNHSVRTEKWRYTKWRDGSEELYDHEKDPNEWQNLAEKQQFLQVKKELSWYIPQKIGAEAIKAQRDKAKQNTVKEKKPEVVIME